MAQDAVLESERVRQYQTAAQTSTIHRFLPREATQATALAQRAGELREQVNSLQDYVGKTHLSAVYTALALRAEAKSRIAPRQLLNDLAHHRGMSWTVIAKMMRVSIPAVRKWRQGEAPSPDNRKRLTVLAAFIEMMEDNFSIADVATWLEMRLWEGVPITPAEIYAEDGLDLLLDMAAGHRDGQAVLDAFKPEWKELYPPGLFEVFEASDGELAIRRRI